LPHRVHPDSMSAAGLVKEEVGGDPVHPALKGARGEGMDRLEDADEDVLCEVLGVVPVAGQAQREAVDPVGMVTNQLLPGGGLPVVGRHLRTHRLLLPSSALPCWPTSLCGGCASD